MKEAIQVNELRKSYGDHAVLKGLTFHVAKGEVFALLGVNGAGKPRPGMYGRVAASMMAAVL